VTRSRAKAMVSGVLTNALAAVSPGLYMRLTEETGRGGSSGDAELADYCLRVFDDYRRVLARGGVDLGAAVDGATVVEYGPGDFLGVALLFLCHGARKVYCIDRFALRRDAVYREAYERLWAAERRDTVPKGANWERLLDEGVAYVAAPDGVAQVRERADLLVSRAVLEHVNDLPATFRNMRENLAEGGVMAHKVDLTSHGTHRETPMDFLCYGETTWHLMTSRKGFPNRFRRPAYQTLLATNGFEVLYEEPEYGFAPADLEPVRDRLAPAFRGLEEEDLLCSDYFFVARRSREW
jgi:hypothetical protein